MGKREKMNGRRKKSLITKHTEQQICSLSAHALIFGFSVLTNEWENFKSERNNRKKQKLCYFM